MQLKQLVETIEYELLQGDLDREITGLVYDSRKVVPGCIFVCISGTRIDAHTFIPQAIKDGAAAIIVEREAEVPKGVTVLLVPGARRCLSELSAVWFHHPLKEMVSIGITGTKGKTTTAYMVKAILEAAGKKAGLIGTVGVMIGSELYPTRNTTPESYELQYYFRKMAEAGCEYIIMEVSSQGIKMDRVAGFAFDYGIFTNITPDHIGPDEHEDFADYLSCKSRLFQMCTHGILNHDDPHFEEILAGHTCDVTTFGMETEANERAGQVRFLREGGFFGVEFGVTGAREFLVRVGIPGLFNVANAMAAITLCGKLGISTEIINHAMEHLKVDGRMEIVYSDQKFSVLVDYAHNAVSMESLLRTLKDYQPKRLVVVFGCGGNRSKLRRYEMGEIGGKMADLSIITADNSRWERVEDILADIKTGLRRTDGKFLEIPDRREAISYAITHAEKGDLIAIIGKGHEDYQEIEGVRHHFLDREEILRCLGMQEESEETR